MAMQLGHKTKQFSIAPSVAIIKASVDWLALRRIAGSASYDYRYSQGNR